MDYKKKVAIVQSNYIPWKGYFDLIASVDEFILFDDAQFTKNDWRNRNLIKTPNGMKWLTIPVKMKGRFPQKIKDATIAYHGWPAKHWKTIVQNYRKAKHFKMYSDFFEELFLNTHEDLLSDVNFRFLSAICRLLEINTTITWSMNYVLVDGKTERLVEMCRQAKATDYLSGPSAGNYIEERLFERANIKLAYADYSGYPEYDQLFAPFEHGVSIVDLIFNVGPDARKYMKA
ncbi:MAG: WbqC family protein [Desulfomonile tiedjei]|nr:WbqC family protein [Desulfomonile tiedjei]